MQRHVIEQPKVVGSHWRMARAIRVIGMNALLLAAGFSAFITLNTFDNIDQVTEACGFATVGCAVVMGRACVVNVLRPQIGYQQDLHVLGHEFLHCYHGDFHGK